MELVQRPNPSSTPPPPLWTKCCEPRVRNVLCGDGPTGRLGGRTWAVWGSGAQVAWVLCGRAANKQALGHLVLEPIAYRKPPVLKPTSWLQTVLSTYHLAPVSNLSGIPY